MLTLPVSVSNRITYLQHTPFIYSITHRIQGSGKGRTGPGRYDFILSTSTSILQVTLNETHRKKECG